MAEIRKEDLDPAVRSYIDGLETVLKAAEDAGVEFNVTDEGDVLVSIEDVEEVEENDDSDTGDESDPVAKLAKSDPALAAYVADLKKKADEAESIAKAEQDRRELTESISKAEPIAKALSTTSDDLGGLLHRLSKSSADPKDVEEVERLLRGAAEQVSTEAIFKELGSVGRGGDKAEQINAAIADIKKNDPNLTNEQAEAKYFEAHPQDYDAFVR